MMDVEFVVLTYLDRCGRVGRQESFSGLVSTLRSEGATPEEIFHGIRWLFDRDYAVRARPDEFTLTDKGYEALEAFRRAPSVAADTDDSPLTGAGGPI